MKILLIDPYVRPHSGVYVPKPSPYMGLAYLASYVKDIPNVSIRIVDMHAYSLTVSDVCKIIVDEDPDIVGISATTVNVNTAYRIFSFAKGNNADVINILGGAHGTALPEHTMTECRSIDCIVRGEGELTFRQIVERCRTASKRSEMFDGVDGIACRNENDEICITNDRELIHDLDVVAMPDYRLYNLDKYDKVYDPVRGRFGRVFSILGSRGCPFGCKFCMPLLGRRIRRRSPAKIVAEIELLNSRYNMRRFYLEDSTATADKSWFVDICQRLISSGLSKKVNWGFESRVDLVDDELFGQAKEAGCTYVYFGMESGSNEILRHMSKGINTERIVEAVSMARNARIDTVAGSFIFGFPYENSQTVSETIELIAKLKLNAVNLNIIDVYPGTELFNMVDNKIGGAAWLAGKRMNWDSYDRKECQITVNDLNESDFKNVIVRARTIVQQQSRENEGLGYLRKVYAYFMHYLSKPSMILYYIRKYLLLKKT